MESTKVNRSTGFFGERNCKTKLITRETRLKFRVGGKEEGYEEKEKEK